MGEKGLPAGDFGVAPVLENPHVLKCTLRFSRTGVPKNPSASRLFLEDRIAERVFCVLCFVFCVLAGSSAYAMGDKPVEIPSNDCELAFADWVKPPRTFFSSDKTHVFILMDRYHGTRQVPDYRGSMCRLKGVQELWFLDDIFPLTSHVAVANDGQYIITAAATLTCKAALYNQVAGYKMLTFYHRGKELKSYTLPELLPEWQSLCEEGKTLRWLEVEEGMNSGFSLDNSELTLRLKNGKKVTFAVASGLLAENP